MKQKIIGIGSPLLDILTEQTEDFIAGCSLIKGGMTLVEKEKSDAIFKKISKYGTSPGGAALNTIKALARLGADTAFLGKTGNDDSGKVLEQALAGYGVKNLFTRETRAGTGKVISIITPDSERTFATYLGAAVFLSADDITPEILKNYQIVYAEGYLAANPELLKKIFKTARSLGIKCALDCASFNVIEEHRELFQELINGSIDIIFANEEEGRALTGKPPREAAMELEKKCRIAVVKAGTEGSYAAARGKIEKITIQKVTAKDTTGAGDFYAAGFIYGLIRELPISVCGKIGSIVSREAVKVFGTHLDDSVWKSIRREISDL